MPDTASGTESPGVYARELARRLERIGIDAFASQNERYLVLLQDSPGEIFVRAGGMFAKWRSSRAASATQPMSRLDKATMQRNRRDTAYSKQPVQTGDRLLSKVKLRYGGSKIAALLFETQSMFPLNADDVRKDGGPKYSTATIVATQEATSANGDVSEERHESPSGTTQKATARAPEYTKSRTSKILGKAAEIFWFIGARIKSVATPTMAACKRRFACVSVSRRPGEGSNQLDEQEIQHQPLVDSRQCLRFSHDRCATENTTSVLISESSEKRFGRLRRLAFPIRKGSSRL